MNHDDDDELDIKRIHALVAPHVSKTLAIIATAAECKCPVCVTRIALAAGWLLAELHAKQAAEVAELQRMAGLEAR